MLGAGGVVQRRSIPGFRPEASEDAAGPQQPAEFGRRGRPAADVAGRRGCNVAGGNASQLRAAPCALRAHQSAGIQVAPASLDAPGLIPCRAAPPLQFTLCNGFANQRFALLSGIVMALELERAVVLPRFVLNGTQATTADVSSADAKGTAGFG